VNTREQMQQLLNNTQHSLLDQINPNSENEIPKTVETIQKLGKCFEDEAKALTDKGRQKC